MISKQTPSNALNNLHFLANVSHEIRNPLHTIIGLSHLLKEETSRTEQEEYIEGLFQTSQDLLEIVNNIMDFSKLESGMLQVEERPVDLRQVINRSLLGLHAMAKANNLELKLDIAENLPPLLMLDSVKLSQVMINLVSNAIKFTNEGGISVMVKAEELQDGQASIHCSVRDTGIGIQEDKLENIFNAFDQGNGEINFNYGGTGLGLTISKALLGLMGGNLKVASCPGKGSEFSFTLSATIAEDPVFAVSTENATENAEVRLQDLRVLLVDDNKLSRLVLQKNLERWNVSYNTAENGLQALEKVQQQDFDLVLLDLHMPVMDGFEAARAIRNLPDEKYRHLNMIALSAATDHLYLEQIKAAGISDFLIKPFQCEELLKKLRAAVLGESKSCR